MAREITEAHGHARTTRFNAITNPPPKFPAILRGIERAWRQLKGKRGLSKNEVRGTVQEVASREIKFGGTDEVWRCLVNAGILVTSLDSGSDYAYFDAHRTVMIKNRRPDQILQPPTDEDLQRRRQELYDELQGRSGKKAEVPMAEAVAYHDLSVAVDALERELDAWIGH